MHAFAHNGRIVAVNMNRTAFQCGRAVTHNWSPFDLDVAKPRWYCRAGCRVGSPRLVNKNGCAKLNTGPAPATRALQLPWWSHARAALHLSCLLGGSRPFRARARSFYEHA